MFGIGVVIFLMRLRWQKNLSIGVAKNGGGGPVEIFLGWDGNKKSEGEGDEVAKMSRQNACQNILRSRVTNIFRGLGGNFYIRREMTSLRYYYI